VAWQLHLQIISNCHATPKKRPAKNNAR